MTQTLHDTSPSAVDNLIERSILDVGIPPCPLILDRFMNEARLEEPDFNRLASIIGSDVGLSAGLIKTANSPYFGLRQRVRSVNEALTILGLKPASRAVAGIILRKAFPNVPNMERFWDASARIAYLSGWLAQHLNIRGLRAEDTYTFGLFRDCGIPVLLGRFPQYEKILNEANASTEQSFTEIENNGLSTNHAMIGCILAQSWWLPEEICLAIRNHHDLTALESLSSQIPLLSRRLIATAQLAEHIVQKQLGLSMTHEWSKLGDVSLRILELDEAQLNTLYSEAESVVNSEL
ncbi:HDOD domain-containing protein [Gallionella capsiferriformans]|jgi:HD-like signal output (HDOD) protein|uniref:Putative signal transduction protein n=1 Tax=Gallionella capsiferriformans (strain ES-2) TaxID=395494 RepID=D9SGI5_GALCS|nr:HDOD domain-containing protein [Gallionella capsiferriformans]ADL55632.1 putative signal transduction protein [Gallionella capsiferriformans ES-2]